MKSVICENFMLSSPLGYDFVTLLLSVSVVRNVPVIEIVDRNDTHLGSVSSPVLLSLSDEFDRSSGQKQR